MKKLSVIFCLLLFSSVSFSQTWNKYSKDYIADDKERAEIEKKEKLFNESQKAVDWNFKIEDGKVYWQKTFEHPYEDSAAVREYFENNPLFTRKNDGYVANIPLSEYSTQSNMNIPFILHAPAEMVFFVQYKEGKYRVTLTNSVWKGSSGTVGMISIMQENTITLQDLAGKSGKFKASSCKSVNICLLNLFDYKKDLNRNDILKDDF